MIGLEKSFQLIQSNTQLRICETLPLIKSSISLFRPGNFPNYNFPEKPAITPKCLVYLVCNSLLKIKSSYFVFIWFMISIEFGLMRVEKSLRPHLQSQNVDIFFILTRKQLALVVTNSSNYFNIYALVAPLSTFRKQGLFWYCCGFSQVR